MGRNRCNYLYLFNKKGINPQLASFASMHSLKKIDYTINLSRIAHCTATKTSSEIFQDPCLSIVISNSVYVCHSQHYEISISITYFQKQFAFFPHGMVCANVRNHFLQKLVPFSSRLYHCCCIRGVLNTREMYTGSKYLAAIQRP